MAALLQPSPSLRCHCHCHCHYHCRRKEDPSSLSSLLLPSSSSSSVKLVSYKLEWQGKGKQRLVVVSRNRNMNRILCGLDEEEGSKKKMNLNEYMVTLDRPLGIRFALSLPGTIFVHSLSKGGNAETSRIIMAGDTLKKISPVSDADGNGDGGFKFNTIGDLDDAKKMLKEIAGSLSLVLERPFSPYPIQKLQLNGDYHILFNRGRVPFTTWNTTVLSSNLQSSSEGKGYSGFAIFTPKFLNSEGRLLLSEKSIVPNSQPQNGFPPKDINEVVCIFSEEDNQDVEWAYGSFPLDEYIKALDRAKEELSYNHLLGMQYSKITEQIYVGSCIQTENDVRKLSDMGSVLVCELHTLNLRRPIGRLQVGSNSSLRVAAAAVANTKFISYRSIMFFTILISFLVNSISYSVLYFPFFN